MTGNYCLWFVTILRHGDDRYDEDQDGDYDNDDLGDRGDWWLLFWSLNAGGRW